MVKSFISYSWDSDAHKNWVAELATRLRKDGVDVTLDKWHLVPGDQIPAFMELAVRESDFVIIVCTPRYKARSDNRSGGVGYEGDIMSGEVLTGANHRKFIPVLGQGSWESAAPTWLTGKYYIDLTGKPYAESQYNDLVTTILGTRAAAPSLGTAPSSQKVSPSVNTASPFGASPDVKPTSSDSFEPIKIIGVVADQVSVPRSDGTRGSALYDVPFRLSHRPPAEWSRFFIASWNHPPRFTTMHRPGIASVVGDLVHLNGTTVHEVKRYHRDTLLLCIAEANKRYSELQANRLRQQEIERKRVEDHAREVQDNAKDIRFD